MSVFCSCDSQLNRLLLLEHQTVTFLYILNDPVVNIHMQYPCPAEPGYTLPLQTV